MRERLNSGQARMIRRPDEASNRRPALATRSPAQTNIARQRLARLDTRVKHPDGPEGLDLQGCHAIRSAVASSPARRSSRAFSLASCS